MAINCATISIFLLTLTILYPFCKADDVLGTNERLYAGERLQYRDYVFTMQKDCNLVLYDNGNPVWASNTGGRSRNCYCIMQSDGNLVVYGNNGAMWASNSAKGEGYYVLVLQKDQKLVIYGSSIWDSNKKNLSVDSLPVSLTSGNDNSIVNVHVADTHMDPNKFDLNTTSDVLFTTA